MAALSSGNDLALLAAQYFQVVDLHALSIPEDSVLIAPEAQGWIWDNMFNEDSVWPLPPVNYRARVLKMLLSRIEQSISDPEEDEISDALMDCYSRLVCSPRPSSLEEAQKLSYIRYTPPGSLRNQESKAIVTTENRNLILSSGTTGFRTWEAALHLGTFLSSVEGRSLVRGKNVVELGAGTGFISMYCAKYLDANSVVATDREPALIAHIQESMAKNGLVSDRIDACVWEWGTPLDSPSKQNSSGEKRPSSFDVALGADLIYDADLVPLLVSTLVDLFENYGVTMFIISATLRNEQTFATFLKACEGNSFSACPLDFQSPEPLYQDGFFHSTNVPIRTYKITRCLHD